MKIVATLLLSLAFIGASSQELMGEFGNRYYTPGLYKSKYNNPEGSPYLNEDFSPASINDNSETYLVRFDTYLGNVEVLIEKGKVIVLDPDQKYIIKLKDGSDRVYETLEIKDESGDIKTTFLELKHLAPNYKLFFREYKKYYKEEKAQAYQEAKPARFKKTKERYFLQDLVSNSAYPIEIPQRTKDFTEVFSRNPKGVRTYLKKEKLKLDQTQDLIKLFDYYFAN